MFVVLRWCSWRSEWLRGLYSMHSSSVRPWGLYSLKEHTGPAASRMSPVLNWMKKIRIQRSRWSNLLAQHHERVGSDGGAALAADGKEEWRQLACRNAEGRRAPDPSSNKVKLQKYVFIWWEISGILSVITENQTSASILLFSKCKDVSFQIKGSASYLLCSCSSWPYKAFWCLCDECEWFHWSHWNCWCI